ncbi:MAG: thioredoxin family protein [Anaerolineales bacterium]|nr:thioredoxin family protein [Anaerolineales bacterium]
MVEIKVLGMICGDCLKMEKVVNEALIELRIDDVEVECICERPVLDYGLQAENTPGLLVDGFLAWAGSIPSKDQVMELIKKANTPTVI